MPYRTNYLPPFSDVLVFDNSFSWLHGKELSYFVEVISEDNVKPDHEETENKRESAANNYNRLYSVSLDDEVE